jgi:DNA polymerase-3 subunit delta
LTLDSLHLGPALAKGLGPAYLILAEEPLQALEAADAIRARARQLDFTARTVLDLSANADWIGFEAAARDRSLFAERGLIDLRLPSGKPGKAGALHLQRYAQQPPPDLILLVQLPRPSGEMRKAAWFKALERIAIVVHARPVPPARLGAWIRDRLSRSGMTIRADALALLASRVEGNLLAARQEIDTLALLGVTDVDLDTVQRGLGDSARFDLFGLSAAALSGQTPRALRMLRGMLAEGQPEPLILWVLSRDIRALAQGALRCARGEPVAAIAKAFRGTDAAALRQALDRIGPTAARDLLARASVVDRVIKGREPGNAGRQLIDLVIALSGRSAARLEKRFT